MDDLLPTERVAREVRAELARQQISGSGLAKTIGRSQSFVQRRLKGEAPFNVEELDAIAKILGVPLSQFWPHDLAS